MKRSRVTPPVLVLLATLVVPSAGLAAARPASASAGTAAHVPSVGKLRESVVVTGTGEVLGEPDTLTADFAVETGAPKVAEALENANAAALRMRDALVRAGIAKADLRTANVSITAKRNEAGEITGYTVNQGLTAKIRNLPKAGAVISAAVAAGGDAARLNGVSFAIEDDTDLLAEARKKAFADARGKAALYAREAGRPLGRVVQVSESQPGYWAGGEKNSLAAADFLVPVEPGRQRLTVTVTVEWALGKPAQAGAISPA